MRPQDIVEGATGGVGQITDSLDVTGLDGLSETVRQAAIHTVTEKSSHTFHCLLHTNAPTLR